MGSPPCARSYASMTPKEAKTMWTLVGRGRGHATGANVEQAQRSCEQQRTGETRTQHFMSDSQCQQKLRELQLLLEALSNTRRTRKDIWDPDAKESLVKFCKGCTHQNVFGCEAGVLPAVPAEDLKETRWLDGQAAQTLTLALREEWETWWADGDGHCFWRSLSLSIWRSQRFYRQVKLVVLAYAAGNSETLVSKGRHLHDNITYYDASVVQKFIGTERAAQDERMLLAELAPLCAKRGWGGRITAYLASEALGCTVKFIHPMDKKARVKQDAGAVSRGRERKGLTFGDNRWSKTYVPTGSHAALRVRGVGGKQDTFVEEATVTFTKHVVERRVSTHSELEALNIADVEGDTDVEGLCHFAAIVPKYGNAKPFPVHEAAPPLYMSKDKEAKRLYDAELAAYADRCVARTAAQQKANVEATAARQQTNPDAEVKVKAAARQQAETEGEAVVAQQQAWVEAAATRQRAEAEAAAAEARRQAEAAAAVAQQEAAAAEARRQAETAAAVAQQQAEAAAAVAQQQAKAPAAAAAPQQHAGVDGDAEAQTKSKMVARQQASVESAAVEALQQASVQQPGVESAAVAAWQQTWAQQPWANAAVAAAWQQPGMEAPAVAAWQQMWVEAPAAAARQQPWAAVVAAQQQAWAQQPGMAVEAAAARQQAVVEEAAVAAWQQTWVGSGTATAWQQAWAQQAWAAAAASRQQSRAEAAVVAPWLQASAQQPWAEAAAATARLRMGAEAMAAAARQQAGATATAEQPSNRLKWKRR